MTEFKVGGKVRCMKGTVNIFVGEVGKTYVVEGVEINGLTINGVAGNDPSRFELAEEKEMQYEDKWHLNDGSKSIPDDAEKLYNPEGTSVVAYRMAKQPVVKEFVRYVSSHAGYPSTGSVYTSTTHKITYVEVDGELTEVTWEKL